MYIHILYCLCIESCAECQKRGEICVHEHTPIDSIFRAYSTTSFETGLEYEEAWEIFWILKYNQYSVIRRVIYVKKTVQ